MNKKTLLLFILIIMISAIGDSLAFAANVGVVPYESVSVVLSSLTQIEVGTILLCLNLLMIICQIITSKKIGLQNLLQIFMVFMLSSIVNFIVYYVFGQAQFDYISRIILMIVGIMISASGVGMLVALDVIIYPLEGFLLALSEKYNLNFEKIRQLTDFICLIISLSLSLLLHVDLAIREGTIIAALLFAPVMGFVNKKMEFKIKNFIK